MNLTDTMRPTKFSEIAGQAHLTDSSSVLMKLIESGSFGSLMFVGPPGTGKTSMAQLVGKTLGREFFMLHAATSGVSDLKRLSELVSSGINILLFIDEIHRYNKSQQDMLLKLIDDGHVCLIGASAENPYHNLVPALRSRSLIFEFKPVDKQGLYALADRAMEKLKTIHSIENINAEHALADLVEQANGDVRRFLNLLELSALIGSRDNGTLTLRTEGLASLMSRRFSDDEYYDVLSAMIKSIRGTDPDGALLWGLKLVKNGVTPEAVFRRLMISASEDIGNAYPDALVFVNSAYQSFMNVGYPEGLIILSQAITFLASCPKSNRSYEAYHRVWDYLDNYDPKVPTHITHNAKDYKYPFSYGDFVKQQYTSKGEQFYFPSESGFESKIKNKLETLWKGVKKYED